MVGKGKVFTGIELVLGHHIPLSFYSIHNIHIYTIYIIDCNGLHLTLLGRTFKYINIDSVGSYLPWFGLSSVSLSLSLSLALTLPVGHATLHSRYPTHAFTSPR
jgi:hypothetical protein